MATQIATNLSSTASTLATTTEALIILKEAKTNFSIALEAIENELEQTNDSREQQKLMVLADILFAEYQKHISYITEVITTQRKAVEQN